MGLGNPDAVGGLRNLIRWEAPSIMFLCETKLNSRDMRKIRGSLVDYNGVEIDSVGRSGGLAVLWQGEVSCSLHSATVHYIDLDVDYEGKNWRFTGFYGWHVVQDRHLSWQHLRLLAGVSDGPWICMGDFNEILFSNEMKGGSRQQWQMNNFHDAVDECGLRDLPLEGYAFTYDNGQGEANRQCRLDKAMITSSWGYIFPYAKLLHLNREWSDHALIKVVLDTQVMEEMSKRPRMFRFEEVLIGEAGCEEVIERAWVCDEGNVMDTISRCAAELQEWKGVSIGKIVRDLKKKRDRLRRLNEGGRNEGQVRERKQLVQDIARLIRQEELFCRQRSRVLWLRQGDKNTKYFYRKAGERGTKNRIAKLVDDERREFKTKEAMAGCALSYFQTLFTSTRPTGFDELLLGVAGRVTNAMNKGLREPYRPEEVLTALNQMHPLKAPGVDGMNALFYQTYWHIVGRAVTRTVLGILNANPFPATLNRTTIVLISKKKAPDKMVDFRPISLCNVLYKLVSKVLANRLKVFLGDIMSENQSAFTPGRLITDNVLVAFEMFHHMKNSRGGGGHMALKLYMSKVYDRVEWVFLRAVLNAMGFDHLWVTRVMDCVETVSYAVNVNGRLSHVLVPERGLRQGDPLSPYLFILCAEVFSSMIRMAVENNSLHGIRVTTNAPVVSHLFFADDSIIFVRAKESEGQCVKDILRQYEMASGQMVSLEKTTVSFSKGTTMARRTGVIGVLGVRMVEEQEKYLGLPMVVGISKQAITKIVRDKLSKKLQGWRGMLLSKGGKEVLIKAVGQSIPTYVMSVFKLPANFCDELRSLVSRFWWGSENGVGFIYPY
ncbi:uncharacterized protein LOC141651749 [Silene latifolia]|uniref:uncharacterized protein LOC141651749 n=1 Tax=Silene latifolia TaxID=37657 RepID=UPI003D7762BC